jgi:toxin ParE1/3/4
MTWRLDIAPAFDSDLTAIQSFLAEQVSVDRAYLQVLRIRNKIPLILENPLIYAEHAELGAGSRLAVVRPYVLIFRIRGDTVRLLRAVHGARDLPRMLREQMS